MDKWGAIFRNIAAFIVIVAAVTGSIYGLQIYIAQQVERKVSDNDFITRVAERVRPFVIFDEKGIILLDKGAMKHLDNIHIELTSKLAPKKIVVSGKEYLANAPVFECLDTYITFVPKRGKKFDWIYEAVEWEFKGVKIPFDFGIPVKWRFRLEIVK